MTVTGMIRQFRNEDARACSDIVRACLERDPQISLEARGQIGPWTSPNALAEFSRLCYAAVYELGDQIVGICGLEMNEIRLLYVSPRHHGFGIGSMMLEHLESMVPAEFFSDIFVYSAPSAQGFYQAHGFGNGGKFDFQLSGIAISTIFMVKPAGAISY